MIYTALSTILIHLVAISSGWNGSKFVCVCVGRMCAGEKKNTCSVQYRRPFGCAVVSIADLLTADTKDDQILKVYAWVMHHHSCLIHCIDTMDGHRYTCLWTHIQTQMWQWSVSCFCSPLLVKFSMIYWIQLSDISLHYCTVRSFNAYYFQWTAQNAWESAWDSRTPVKPSFYKLLWQIQILCLNGSED